MILSCTYNGSVLLRDASKICKSQVPVWYGGGSVLVGSAVDVFVVKVDGKGAVLTSMRVVPTSQV